MGIDPVVRLIVMAALGLVLSGCIYAHTVAPLTADFTGTPAGNGSSSGEIKTVTFYVSVEWDKNGIGTIAKKHGIEEIYYADIETVSVFRYWTQKRVHVYGR